MLDIHTVGAGGGSIAYVTEGGLLRVGPFSAGADPGPACYGRGGENATVTDADLLLGYLDPGTFLAGRMALDADAARAAVAATVAEPLGLDVLEAAAGIYDVVNVNMAAGIREVTVNRGWDPRDFPLVVAGGAGPIHGASIADEMGISLLVVPRESSIFCAGGMLIADFKHDHVRGRRVLLDGVDASELAEVWSGMRDAGLATTTSEGLEPGKVRFLPSLDVRYEGQWYEINVAFDADAIDAPDLASIEKSFHERHDLLFGYSTMDMPVELISIRLAVVGDTPKPPLTTVAEGGAAEAARRGERPAWSRATRRMVTTSVYDGTALGAGARLAGPAVIELATTAIVVPESFAVVVDALGSFVLYTPSREDEVLSALTAHPQTTGALP
jgi:N-methylhydantoinase A